MKNGTPSEPVIAYDHLRKENMSKDPAYVMTRKILFTAEFALVLTLLVAMFYLY